MRRSKSALTLAAVVCTATAVAGPAAAAPSRAAGSSAAAAAVWSVSDPVVTPVLADDPYTPVFIGGDPDEGDPGDCWFTGYEDHGVTGENGLDYATGCGGVRMQVTIGSDVEDADGTAYLTVTATSAYGCVHSRTGRTRTVLTATHELPGRTSIFEIPEVTAAPTTMHAVALLPLETVTCRGNERPSHLSTTVSDLQVDIEPFGAFDGAHEVHEVSGTWNVERPAAVEAHGRSAGPKR